MNQFSDLVPNGMQVSAGIHFQHPDQPISAATLPQTHPLKTRIATLLQALHFMRDWLASQSVLPWLCHLSFHYPLARLWGLDSRPPPVGRNHFAGNVSSFR
jgi:hypothetical protein